jgi:hypothetical protein
VPLKGFQKEKCIRGHELEDWSTSPASYDQGRRCIACNRATSSAWNWEKRNGIYLSLEEFNDLCDAKFEALKIEKGIR